MFDAEILLILFFGLTFLLWLVLKDRKVVSGRLFNLAFYDKTFVKITTEIEFIFPTNYCNSEICFKSGYYESTKVFNPTNNKSIDESSGGIFFIDYTEIYNMIHENKNPKLKYNYIRHVIIPNDAKVEIMGNGKFKTDKIYLGPYEYIANSNKINDKARVKNTLKSIFKILNDFKQKYISPKLIEIFKIIGTLFICWIVLSIVDTLVDNHMKVSANHISSYSMIIDNLHEILDYKPILLIVSE